MAVDELIDILQSLATTNTGNPGSRFLGTLCKINKFFASSKIKNFLDLRGQLLTQLNLLHWIFAFSFWCTTLMSVQRKAPVLIMFHYVSDFPHRPQVPYRSKTVLTRYSDECQKLLQNMQASPKIFIFNSQYITNNEDVSSHLRYFVLNLVHHSGDFFGFSFILNYAKLSVGSGKQLFHFPFFLIKDN